MVKLSKKTKIAIAATVAVALLLVIVIPFVSAQTDPISATSNAKTLRAQGYDLQKIDNETIKYYSANFTLSLQPTSNNSTVRRFDVTGGTVTVNGVSYSITTGVGGVLPGRHLVLIKAEGTGPDGQPVTLGLEGRYFWMWGQQYVIRMAGKLQTDNGNSTLLMRAVVTI